MHQSFPPRVPRPAQRGDPEFKTMAQAAWTRCRAVFLASAFGLLAVNSAQAQVSGYSYAYTAGVYTDLGATGTAITVANNNDATSAAIPIGFNFSYNGATFTRFMLNTNGFIKLGTVGMSGPSRDDLFGQGRTSTANSTFSSTDPADENIIAATNTDWNTGVGGTEYRYLTAGAPGSRTTTIQWKNVGDNWGNQQYQAANFQLILTEGTNSIQIKHGTWTINAASTNAYLNTYAGLKGNSGNVRSLAKSSSSLTSTATAATSTGTTWSIARPSPPAVTGNHIPTSGTTYTFAPPAPIPRALGTLVGVQPFTTNVEKNSTDNPVLRVTVPTTGNSGSLTLNDVTVTTPNTAATVSSVKLWYSSSATFSTATAVLLGTTTVSFNSAVFTGLTQALTLPTAYLHVTFDIAGSATIGQTVDASIIAGDIVITADGGATPPGGQPGADIDPAGTRTIGFCTSAASTPGSDEDIGRVRFAGIDNAPGGETPVISNPAANNGYTDFTSLTGTVRQGEPYQLTVNIINKGTSVYATTITAFIDFNQNGSFNDPGEAVFTEVVPNTSPATVATRQAQAVVQIPVTALLGTTRMRIVAAEGSVVKGPCDTYSWGETEDYSVTVLAPPACSAPTSVSVNNETSTSAQVNFDLGMGGGTAEVEYGAPGFTPGTGTLVTGLTTSPYTITGLTANSGYDAYVRRNCGGTFSARVGPLSFTTSKAPMSYAITRTEGITYASIRNTSTALPFSGTSLDTQLSDALLFSNTAIFPSGFTFHFPSTGTAGSGPAVTGFRASTNGYLFLDPTQTQTGTTNNLALATYPMVVAPFWEDLVGVSLDSMRYSVTGAPGSQVLTIEWLGWRRYLVTGSDLNFQVKLFEGTDIIRFDYGTMSAFDDNGTTSAYSYSLGISGDPANEIASQQFENSAVFANLSENTLKTLPTCNSRITFTPGTYVAPLAPIASAPANDACAAAIQLPVGTKPASTFCTLYTTALANPSVSPVPVCSAPTPGNPDDDVWFAFTVPAGPAKDISIRVAASTGFNPVVQLLSGTCGSFTALNCENATTTGSFETIMATALTGGATYYVRVYDSGVGSGTAASNSTFGITVYQTPQPPVNDNPAGAITIGGATCTPINGTTFGATNTAAPANTCAGTASAADDDVWYKVVLAGPVNSIEVTAVGVGSFNAVLGLYSGAPTTNITCSNTTTTGIESLTAGGLTPGTYYIRLYSLGTTATGKGDFTICARTFTSVANDECAGAVALPVNATCVNTTGSTLNATGSTAPLPPTCSVTTPVDDVWYTVTGTTNLRVTVAGTTPNFNPAVQLLSGTCGGTFTSILCRSVETGSVETLTRIGLNPALTYYIRVQGATGSVSGNFNICAEEISAPANDQPANAVALVVGPTGCNSPTAGTTILATATAGVAVCSDITGGTPDDDVWYKFTPTSSAPSISVTQSSFDAIIQLLREDPMNPGTFLTLQCEDGGVSGVAQLDASGLTPGQLYYVRVYSYGSAATAQNDFTICVSQQPKVLAAQTLIQASSSALGVGTNNAEILRLQLRVTGGAGFLPLQSIEFQSNNISNADLANNGVKLWASRSTVFDVATSTLIGTGRNFTGGGTVTFSGLNFDLPGGNNYIYLTYNVKPTATVGNTLDAQLVANSIVVNGTNYTTTTTNPTGTRLIAPPPPANDLACGAFTLPVVSNSRPTYQSYSTIGAFDSSPTLIGTCSAGISFFDDDVYFKFTVPANGEVNIDTRKPVGSTLGDSRIQVLSGVCSGSLTVLGCNDSDGLGDMAALRLTGLTPGETLFIRLGTISGTTGAFEIALTNRPIFTGAVSSSFTDVKNFAPAYEAGLAAFLSTAGVVIPLNAVNMPTIGAATTLGGLDIRAGATLTQTAGTLTVNGAFVKGGTFTQATAATVVVGATAAATISSPSAITFQNLTVGNNGATLQGPAAVQIQRLLTLDGQLATAGNPLVLLSNATATAMAVNNVGGGVVGNATVQRYLDPSANPGLGYRHLSAPVTNTTVADLQAYGPFVNQFTPIVNSAFNAAANPAAPGAVVPYPNVFDYDDSRVDNAFPVMERGYRSPTSLADPLVPGMGYTAYMRGTVKPDFVGTLGNGDVTVGVQNTNGLIASGWNLLGNPYPSPMDWDLLAPAAITTAGLNAQVSVYKSQQSFSTAGAIDGIYLTRANGIGTLPDGLIPSAQGFLVRRETAGTGTLTFTNALRPTSYTNPTHFRTAPDTRPVAQLSVRQMGRTEADYATVYFEAGASTSTDQLFDGYKLHSTGSMPSVFTRAADGEELAINGLPELVAGSTTTVPLEMKIRVAGSYSLQLDEARHLPAGTQLWLTDALTGTRQELSADLGYVVTLAEGTTGNRFALVFGPANGPTGTSAALSGTVVRVYPNPVAAAAELRVSLTGVPATAGNTVQATLLDNLGRTVRQFTLSVRGGVAEGTASTTGLSTGVYSLRLQAGNATEVRRVVVE